MSNYFWCSKCGGTFDPAHKFCPNCDGTYVKELEERNAELVDGLTTAIHRLDDMLMGDDGQAWKEAQKALPRLRAMVNIKDNGSYGCRPLGSCVEPKCPDCPDHIQTEEVTQGEAT